MKSKREKGKTSCVLISILVRVLESKGRNDQTFEWISGYRLHDFKREAKRLWSWGARKAGRTEDKERKDQIGLW